MEESALGGGAVNEVVRVGETVRRTPVSPERSRYVTGLLGQFERRGWPGAPRFLGTDERGREMFRYIEGRAAVSSEERAAVRTDDSLVRVAQLVRAFHDLTHGTPQAGEQDVVCHNDLAPKNTVYDRAWHPWRSSTGTSPPPASASTTSRTSAGSTSTSAGGRHRHPRDRPPDRPDLRGVRPRRHPPAPRHGAVVAGPVLKRGIEAGAGRGERGMVALRARGVVDEIRDARAWVAAHHRELGAFLR